MGGNFEAGQNGETVECLANTENAEKRTELPDDSGDSNYKSELPDDSGDKLPEKPLEKTADCGREPPKDESNSDDIDDSVKNISSEMKNPRQEVIDGVTFYYDDNKKCYRIGKDLVSNSEYEVNGYKYITDEFGRIISVEGKLQLKDREGRLPIKDSIEDIGKGDEKEGDDRGHLIGDQFNGSNGLENMIPQDANINRNDFKNFENELAKEVKNGENVVVKIEPVYDGDSRRPTAIVVTYSVNGEESVRVFPNSQGA